MIASIHSLCWVVCIWDCNVQVPLTFASCIVRQIGDTGYVCVLVCVRIFTLTGFPFIMKWAFCASTCYFWNRSNIYILHDAKVHKGVKPGRSKHWWTSSPCSRPASQKNTLPTCAGNGFSGNIPQTGLSQQKILVRIAIHPCFPTMVWLWPFQAGQLYSPWN